MSRVDFIKDKALYLVCQLAVAAVTVVMLLVLNPRGGAAFSILVALLYLLGAAVPLFAEWHRRHGFYQSLLENFERLDRKNLVAEMVSAPAFFEGALFVDILRGCNRAYLEEIKQFQTLHAEYREYIELWVHEIKTPIASGKLLLANHRNELSDSMGEELDQIEAFVEQVLYYARSRAVEKDYVIRSMQLEKPVFAAIKRNSPALIRTKISVTTEDLGLAVFSDAKWIEFIVSQLLVNAIKYAREKDAKIVISAAESDNSCLLDISDNGLGIPADELPRIFDKGFTGTNGRLRGKSTGMGLYICRTLCEKLGISISATSEPGVGTTIRLTFPKSAMTGIL